MYRIKLEDVCKTSLRDTFGRDKEGNDSFEYIEGLVKMVLFSNFQKRRGWARSKLPIAFHGTKVDLNTIKKDGIIYAYLKFDGAAQYMFVGMYREDIQLFEPVPEDIEISQWSG